MSFFLRIFQNFKTICFTQHQQNAASAFTIDCFQLIQRCYHLSRAIQNYREKE